MVLICIQTDRICTYRSAWLRSIWIWPQYKTIKVVFGAKLSYPSHEVRWIHIQTCCVCRYFFFGKQYIRKNIRITLIYISASLWYVHDILDNRPRIYVSETQFESCSQVPPTDEFTRWNCMCIWHWHCDIIEEHLLCETSFKSKAKCILLN